MSQVRVSRMTVLHLHVRGSISPVAEKPSEYNGTNGTEHIGNTPVLVLCIPKFWECIAVELICTCTLGGRFNRGSNYSTLT